VNTLLDALTAAYPVPSCNTDAQHDRYYHLDVPSLTRPDRARELTLVRLIVFLGGGEWYAERERALAGGGT
jgi:hypothetical protein